jgi:DNA-binding NtrC family response regulator
MAEPVIHRILVIDEDADLRSFYAHVLTTQGHEVVTAADTTEADDILDSESEPFSAPTAITSASCARNMARQHCSASPAAGPTAKR